MRRRGAPPLRITWLYPDILNLHGDRGNLMALVRLCEQAKIGAELTRLDRLGDPLDLDGVDLLWLGPGELAVMTDVVRALSPYAEKLRAWLAQGRGLFVNGTTGAVVAGRTRRLDGSQIDGLGLLGMTMRERPGVYGDDLLVNVDGVEVGGVQIRLTNAHLERRQAALGQVVYGLGNDPDHPRQEGARTANLVFTHLAGPVMVRNPWFAWRWIEDVWRRTRPGVGLPEPKDDWAWQRQSAAAARAFNAGKRPAAGVVRLK